MKTQQSKFRLSLIILTVGMFLALCFHGIARYHGYGYPYNTFLFTPRARFSDFTDSLRAAKYIDPYLTPAGYPPTAYAILRLFPWGVGGLMLFFLIGIIPIVWLLARALKPVYADFSKSLAANQAVAKAIRSLGLSQFAINSLVATTLTFLLLFCCCPFLYCLDRGNLDLWVVFLVGFSLFHFCKAQLRRAALWLVLPICLKMYPCLLLILFVRHNTLRLIALTLAAVLALTVFSYSCFSGNIIVNYLLNKMLIAEATENYLIGNLGLGEDASPWNLYRVTAMAWHALQTGTFFNPIWYWHSLIPQFRTALPVYTKIVFVVTLLIAAYSALIEREVLRRIAGVIVFMVLASPSGSEPKITLIGIALVVFVLVKTQRRGDLLVTAMLAFTLIPKKEYMLTFLGPSDSQYLDISSGVILNPLAMMIALGVLCWNGMAVADLQWTWQRLLGVFTGLRPAWFNWTARPALARADQPPA